MFSLQSQHTDDSVTWDFMARRELEVGGASELPSAQSRAADIMSREERCSAVYEEGLKSLNTGNSTEMKPLRSLFTRSVSQVWSNIQRSLSSTWTCKGSAGDVRRVNTTSESGFTA